jgi:hypothetical protein
MFKFVCDQRDCNHSIDNIKSNLIDYSLVPNDLPAYKSVRLLQQSSPSKQQQPCSTGHTIEELSTLKQQQNAITLLNCHQHTLNNNQTEFVNQLNVDLNLKNDK